MSFGKDAHTQLGPAGSDPPPLLQKRSNVHWFRGGILTLLLPLANFVHFLMNGKSLPSRTSGREMGAGGAIALTLGALIFGIFALFMHFRQRDG